MVVGDSVCAPCSIANSLETLLKVRSSVSSHRQAEKDDRAYNSRHFSTCNSCLSKYSPLIHDDGKGIRTNEGALVGARLVL